MFIDGLTTIWCRIVLDQIRPGSAPICFWRVAQRANLQPMRRAVADRVLEAVDAAAPEIVGFTSELIRVPTVNPPGEHYADCARIIGEHLEACGFEVDVFAAEGCAEHT